MPRTGRGGARQGTPGKAYPNRSDMRQPKPPIGRYVGQPYGQQAAQVAAQQQVPVAAPPQPAPPPNPMQNVQPGSIDLLGETARPDEPLTAGLSSGPGPGPEALQMAGAVNNPDLDQLRAVFAAHPSPALRDLIGWMESNR